MSKISTLIANFIRDERGSESTEVGVTTVVLAGGSASQLTQLKGTIQTKVGEVNTAVGGVGIGTE